MFKNSLLDYSETEAIFNFIFLFFSPFFFSNSIPFYLDNGNIKLSLKTNIYNTDGSEDNHENIN